MSIYLGLKDSDIAALDSRGFNFFLEEIKSSFENKTVEKIEYLKKNEDSQLYKLVYTTNRNKIKVSVTIDNSWTYVKFIINELTNLNAINNKPELPISTKMKLKKNKPK